MEVVVDTASDDLSPLVQQLVAVQESLPDVWPSSCGRVERAGLVLAQVDMSPLFAVELAA